MVLRRLIRCCLPPAHVFFPETSFASRNVLDVGAAHRLGAAGGGLGHHHSHDVGIVRDGLATHVLKQTGSYEQASYAIQDTPDTVAEHYGRFLPQDKAALAAQVLNQVWA